MQLVYYYISLCYISLRDVFFLFQGKVVIRPIAFKPAIMTPAARFGLAGERYGSTPILTRPGSRLTLYGSEFILYHWANRRYDFSERRTPFPTVLLSF